MKDLQPCGKISKKLVIDTPEAKQANFFLKELFFKSKGKKESCSKKKKANES